MSLPSLLSNHLNTKLNYLCNHHKTAAIFVLALGTSYYAAAAESQVTSSTLQLAAATKDKNVEEVKVDGVARKNENQKVYRNDCK